MKKFIRIKERRGHKYAYEITPYYDPEIKNTRQKSKYLGVHENGKIRRKRTNLPVCVFDYGEFIPFMKILDELNIRDILGSILSKKQLNTVLTLALNKVVKPVSACNIQTWYEGTCLSKVYGDIPLSSQSLSEFMETIGESSVPRDFSQQFINTIGAGQPLLYDITSLSSSSKLMDILEFGYNRDDDHLPQLNLSIVAHKDIGIPLCFDIYPGSVVDISTLKNTTKKLNSFGLKNPTMILDRGFFSETNLNELIESKYNFIIPASFASKKVKSIVSKSRNDIENPDHMHMFNGSTIFVKSIEFEMENRVVHGYVFYDLKREKDDKSKFYNRLQSIIERLRKRKLRQWERPSKVFEDISGKLSSYLRWKAKEGMFEVKVKNKAVAQRVNRMGFTVILYKEGYGWEEVLNWTRERDVIEKMFMRLKNDLEATPMRAQKTEVAKGWIFVTFLSLILRCRLSRMLIETKLAEKYSIPSLLLTLGRLKKVELSDSSIVVTEVTKKQRDILKKLEVTP